MISNYSLASDDAGRFRTRHWSGVLHSAQSQVPETAVSVPGSFAGTPEFASPEQFAGVGIDIRSDLYSLGATLWNMLAGQSPFRGTSAELMHQHLHTALPTGELGRVRRRLQGDRFSF